MASEHERSEGTPSRRKQILAAAERLFRQYGPRKTTIADIARAAEVGVGSVYLEFATKSDILLALSASRHEVILAAMEQAWRGEGPPEARLLRVLEARLDAFLRCARGSVHGAEMVHCRACGPIQQAHLRYRDEERALFTRVVSEGMEARAFRAGDPARLAEALLLVYRAFAPPDVFEAQEVSLRASLAEVHALVVNGLLRSPVDAGPGEAADGGAR